MYVCMSYCEKTLAHLPSITRSHVMWNAIRPFAVSTISFPKCGAAPVRRTSTKVLQASHSLGTHWNDTEFKSGTAACHDVTVRASKARPHTSHFDGGLIRRVESINTRTRLRRLLLYFSSSTRHAARIVCAFKSHFAYWPMIDRRRTDTRSRVGSLSAAALLIRHTEESYRSD